MVDTDQIVEAIPHYVAMLLIVFLVLGVIRTAVGELSFWIELVIVLVIAVGYQSLVKYLDLAPSSWEKR